MKPGGPTSTSYEIASVLFMDIVGYSIRSIDEQAEALTTLEGVVRASSQFQNALTRDELISIPTGDGMALVFLRDPVSPVKCALEVAAALKDHPEIGLRMGVHQGPVCRHADIKKEVNVVGGGINIAQRVMDSGDAGHILLSRNVAEMLEQLRGWSGCLQDLGMHEVKHGVEVHLYNLCKDGLGNVTLPKKLAAHSEKTAKTPDARTNGSPPIPPLRAATARSGRLLVFGVAGVISLAAVSYFVYQRSQAETVIPTSPQASRTLQYYITVQKYREGKPYEKPFQTTGTHIFESDFHVRVSLSSSQSGYLYILNEGPHSTEAKPDLNTLFPVPSSQGGIAHIDPNQQINIPQKDFIVFDSQKGEEGLWLVWSTAPIKQFEDLKKWANERDLGAIHDPSQAREVLALLSKYSKNRVDAIEDKANKIMAVKCQGDVLVYRLALEHE